MTELENLQAAAAALEAQRALLGDAVVDAGLAALREKLAALQGQVSSSTSDQPFQPRDERRLITILYSDVAGSVSLAERLDPEEWKQTIAAVQSTIGQIVSQHHGLIAQYQGDALIAFFGAREASELDAENAVRAALAAQSAVQHLELLGPVPIRMGIHTGLVVLGAWGADAKIEFGAFGDAVNVAARLQTAAPLGGVLISHDTYRYVRGLFELSPQPPLLLKGKSEPIQTYVVTAARQRPFRNVTRGVLGVQTQTVGREREVQVLQDAYREALEQHRAVWAQIVGEPGVGKSRLVEDMQEWMDLRPESVWLLRGRAFSGETNQPFAIVRRMWFERFGIAQDTPLAQAEADWEKGFSELFGQGVDQTRPEEFKERAHAFGLLLGLPFQDSPYIRGIRNDPNQIRGRAFVVSQELLSALRRASPVVMLLEDLHWMDSASWEWLQEVVLNGDGGRRTAEQELKGFFVLATARPEWEVPEGFKNADRRRPTANSSNASVDSLKPSLGGAEGKVLDYWQLDLSPLSAMQSEELVRALLSKVKDLPKDLIQLVVTRSEGVPYFAEELVNLLIDRGLIDTRGEVWGYVPQPLEASQLPQTLQHLLLTRLISLPLPQRTSLQRGSVYGRRFWAGGVEALGVEQPEPLLRSMRPRGFIEAQPESSLQGESEWSFHHNLLRDVTYESILKRERANLHRAAAGWLEEQAGRAGRLDEFAGILGEHCERAGERSTAGAWYLRAGERALMQGATYAAKNLLVRALELLPQDDRDSRWRAQLALDQVFDTLADLAGRRANVLGLLELVKQSGNDGRLAETYMRQAGYAHSVGDLLTQLEAAEQAVAAARRSGNRALESRALGRKISATRRLGDTQGARQAGEQLLALMDGLEDPEAIAIGFAMLGVYYAYDYDLERSAEFFLRAKELAHQLGDRLKEALDLTSLGTAYALLGLFEMAGEAFEQALRLDEVIGARHNRAYNLMSLGENRLQLGDARGAQQLEEQALAELTAIGDYRGRAGSLEILGHIAEAAGDIIGAARRYATASNVYTSMGARHYATECLADLARCGLAEGRLDEARQDAEQVWRYLNEHGIGGMERPILAYETCAKVFEALGEADESRKAVEAGYHELMGHADKVTNSEWHQSFLENVLENRALVAHWRRLHPEEQ